MMVKDSSGDDEVAIQQRFVWEQLHENVAPEFSLVWQWPMICSPGSQSVIAR